MTSSHAVQSLCTHEQPFQIVHLSTFEQLCGMLHLLNAVRMSMLRQLAQGLGIDIGAVALFAFLVRRDLAARDKQMARMLREEKLGVLQLELANRKARSFMAGSLRSTDL